MQQYDLKLDSNEAYSTAEGLRHNNILVSSVIWLVCINLILLLECHISQNKIS